MEKYLIQLEQSPRAVWINRLDLGNRYVLPQDEYISRYTIEKERKGSFEAIATNFEWGYEGVGPALLGRALADEIFDGNATDKQRKLILDKVMNAQHGKDSEFLLEF